MVPGSALLLWEAAGTAKTGCPEDAFRGKSIGSTIEPPANCLPTEVPPLHTGIAEALFKVRLQVQAAKPGSAGSIADDR